MKFCQQNNKCSRVYSQAYQGDHFRTPRQLRLGDELTKDKNLVFRTQVKHQLVMTQNRPRGEKVRHQCSPQGAAMMSLFLLVMTGLSTLERIIVSNVQCPLFASLQCPLFASLSPKHNCLGVLKRSPQQTMIPSRVERLVMRGRDKDVVAAPQGEH